MDWQKLFAELAPLVLTHFLPVILIFVIVYLVARQRQRNAGVGGIRAKHYAQHHQIEWSGDPNSFRPTADDRALATAALYCARYRGPWNQLNVSASQDCRIEVANEWRIHNPEQLRLYLSWMIGEGCRGESARIVKEWAQLDSEAATEIRKKLQKEKQIKDLWRFDQVRKNNRNIREAQFVALDLVQIAALSRLGYSLGWLGKEIAMDNLYLVTAELQRHYTSWEQMGNDFVVARWFQKALTGSRLHQLDAYDKSRLLAVTNQENGPWAFIPWEMKTNVSQNLLCLATIDEVELGNPQGPVRFR